FEGLADTRRLLRESGDEHCNAVALETFDAALQRALTTRPSTLAAAWRCIDELAACAEALRPAIGKQEVAEPPPDKVAALTGAAEAAYWLEALIRQSARARDELVYLTPWVRDQQSGESVDIAIPSLGRLAEGVGGAAGDGAARTRA